MRVRLIKAKIIIHLTKRLTQVKIDVKVRINKGGKLRICGLLTLLWQNHSEGKLSLDAAGNIEQ